MAIPPTATEAGTSAASQQGEGKLLFLGLPSSLLHPTTPTADEQHAGDQQTSPPTLSDDKRRFLTLPHPRSHVPCYFLPSPGDGSQDTILELQSIAEDGKGTSGRSWFLSSSPADVPSATVGGKGLANTIHPPSSSLCLLAPISPLFLVLSILSPLFPPSSLATVIVDDGEAKQPRKGGRQLPYDDMFEEAALWFGRERRTKFDTLRSTVGGKVGSTSAVVAPSGRDGEMGQEEETWDDIVRLGALPCIRRAVESCCDVQSLEDGQNTYRPSLSKTLARLDEKLSRLSTQTTFDRAPNTLGRAFERRYDGPTEGGEEQRHKLRTQIAAETIMAYLDPAWCSVWAERSTVLVR